MPPHLVLAWAEYGTDFIQYVSQNNIWDYKDMHSDTNYETILVGEVRPALCGTRFSAKGTHYMGSMSNVCD